MPQRPPRRCQRCGAPIADGAPFGRIEALSIGLPGGDPAAVRWLLCGPCIAEVRECLGASPDRPGDGAGEGDLMPNRPVRLSRPRASSSGPGPQSRMPRA